MNHTPKEQYQQQRDDILKALEIAILEAVGDRLAPKKPEGSPERKQLLAVIGDVLPNMDEAAQALDSLLLTEFKRLVDTTFEMYFSKEVPVFTSLEDYMEHVATVRDVFRSELRKAAEEQLGKR